MSENVKCADCGADLGPADARTGKSPDAIYDDRFDGDPLCDGCFENAEDSYSAGDDAWGGGFGDEEGIAFADPGGRSALRAATPSNPRELPCPSCGTENVLTPADRALGYCCDRCANSAEGVGP